MYHTGSTNNIQDLRNFAHFAQKTPSRKYKKIATSRRRNDYFKDLRPPSTGLPTDVYEFSAILFPILPKAVLKLAENVYLLSAGSSFYSAVKLRTTRNPSHWSEKAVCGPILGLV